MINAELFTFLKENKKRILSIDFGKSQIGFAISDFDLKISFPLKVIKNKGFNDSVIEIKKIIIEYKIGLFLIGLPTKMSGSDSDITDLVRRFADFIKEQTETEYIFYDERFSTLSQNKMLIKEFDMSRSKRKEIIDKLAAQYFLSTFLDLNNKD